MTALATDGPLVEAAGLAKFFKTPMGLLHAVDGVDLQVARGRTLGVVGESGCGKSTLGRLLLRLIEPSAGRVLFRGEDLTTFSRRRLRHARRRLQIIFQDPYSSLNPRMSVGELIAEPLIVHRLGGSAADRGRRVSRLMDLVGLADRLVNAYPHELDGGRRQRVGIARALSLEPEFLVLDEPVSALDVSIQAQILNLLMDLQEELSLTYVFITHNLAVVRHISDEIAVMYLGRCVERAPAKELFSRPTHPYAQALLDAVPRPRLRRGEPKKPVIRGELTSPIDPPPGCRFAARCPRRVPECSADPPQIEISPGHFCACPPAAASPPKNLRQP
ncbi:MAG: ATP-binding cassette domain-containing protein [Deltaproteobacteria bacterium]|jgi:peptide/nickel transport system ATP-binding protein|nr:ATP-binding cassette domain-containing protein [Deltaproteobacteria bacterium]